MSKPTRNSKRVTVASALIVIVGICGTTYVFFAFALPNVLRYYSSRHWTPATCTIQHASYEYQYDGSRGGGHRYKPDVSFSYLANGNKFEASTPDLWGKGFKTREALDKWLAQFSEGAVVSCLVNPSRPMEAILEREGSLSGFMLPPLTLLFLTVLIGVLLSYVSHLRRAVEPPV